VLALTTRDRVPARRTYALPQDVKRSTATRRGKSRNARTVRAQAENIDADEILASFPAVGGGGCDP